MAEQDPPDPPPEDGPEDAENGRPGARESSLDHPPVGKSGPDIRIIRPLPAPQRERRGIPLTRAKYDALWDLYRAGERGVLGLARAGGIAKETSRRAIEKGWPNRGWDSLRERAKLIDRQRLDVEAKAATEHFREEVDEFYRARRRNLKHLEAVTAFGFTMLTRIQQAMASSTFSRARRVKRILDGQAQEVDELYIPAREVATALRQTAAAIRDVGAYELEWLKVGAGMMPGQTAAAPGEEATPVAPMTGEQVKYVLEHDGALPPGVTDEQVLATMSAMFGGGAKKAGEP
jgi:hypothetical protein